MQQKQETVPLDELLSIPENPMHHRDETANA